MLELSPAAAEPVVFTCDAIKVVYLVAAPVTVAVLPVLCGPVAPANKTLPEAIATAVLMSTDAAVLYVADGVVYSGLSPSAVTEGHVHNEVLAGKDPAVWPHKKVWALLNVPVNSP
jgi:hypothetical protein